MLVKMGASSPSRGENKKYLKPPPSQSLPQNVWCQIVDSMMLQALLLKFVY